MNNQRDGHLNWNALLRPETKDYVDAIGAYLCEYTEQGRQDIRQEILQHLEAMAAEELASGKTPLQAVTYAMAHFGNPYAIGAELREARIDW